MCDKFLKLVIVIDRLQLLWHESRHGANDLMNKDMLIRRVLAS